MCLPACLPCVALPACLPASGFRRLGFNVPFSLWAVLVINPAFSLVSSPGWLPDPLMRVFTANIHRGKHGSDQEVGR